MTRAASSTLWVEPECPGSRSPYENGRPHAPDRSRHIALKKPCHLLVKVTCRVFELSDLRALDDRYRMAPCNNCGMEPDVADLTLPEEDRQELIRWTVACVERLLPVFEADRPEDPRLSDALDGARQFAAGRLSVGPMRKLAFGCHAAAREASTAPATAVARACGQAVAVAHMAGHSREIVRYTSKALTGKTLAQELEWQRTHMPARFRDYVYGDAV